MTKEKKVPDFDQVSRIFEVRWTQTGEDKEGFAEKKEIVVYLKMVMESSCSCDDVQKKKKKEKKKPTLMI